MPRAALAAIVSIVALWWVNAGAAQNGDLGPDLDRFRRAAVATDEGTLSYAHRAGRGTAPALVLVPGSFCDSHQWHAIVSALDPSWTIVLVDVRGHGHSWPPPSRGSIEQFGADVVRVLDALRIRRAFVGGHSIGGMIALEVGRAHPERVAGIVSVEGWTHAQVIPDAFAGAVVTTLTPGQMTWRAEERRRVTRGWTDEQRRAFAEIYKRWDGLPFLRATTLPILEIYGDRGKARPSREALRIPDRPNIRLEWIAGASHELPLEQPAMVARLIDEFVSRTHAATGGEGRGK